MGRYKKYQNILSVFIFSYFSSKPMFIYIDISIHPVIVNTIVCILTVIIVFSVNRICTHEHTGRLIKKGEMEIE